MEIIVNQGHENNGFEVSEEDVSAFSEELVNGQVVRFEDFANDVYLDSFIEKPWGHEYRVYADMLVDVWKLSLAPGQSTSMHCHPRKETVLMCLAGRLRVNFLHRAIEVEAGQYARIPRGLFHSTDNLGAADAHLLEVETPRNKFDLVRRNDRYGRQGQPYETRANLSEIAGMSVDATAPCSKLRKRDLEGLFRFDVLSGTEVARAGTRPEFVVSLSVEAAICQRIDIYGRDEVGASRLKPDMRHLVVSRT